MCMRACVCMFLWSLMMLLTASWTDIILLIVMMQARVSLHPVSGAAAAWPQLPPQVSMANSGQFKQVSQDRAIVSRPLAQQPVTVISLPEAAGAAVTVATTTTATNHNNNTSKRLADNTERPASAQNQKKRKQSTVVSPPEALRMKCPHGCGAMTTQLDL